jgi:alcohol dehydrogenase class IV
MLGLVDEGASKEEARDAFILHIDAMNKRMVIPTKLECVNKDDIPYLANLADKEANPLYPVPTLWNAKELEKIYLLIRSEK